MQRREARADGMRTVGTTSVTVLAAELLREAEKLVTLGRVHPQTYVRARLNGRSRELTVSTVLLRVSVLPPVSRSKLSTPAQETTGQSSHDI
jgi:hypothetical protein